MFRVTIVLYPAGGGAPQEIGRMDVENEGTTSTLDRGDYVARIFRRGSTSRVQRVVEVKNYPRKSLPVWELVHRLLAGAKASSLDQPEAEPTQEMLDLAIARLGPEAGAAKARRTVEIEALLEALTSADSTTEQRTDAILRIAKRMAAGDALGFAAEQLAAALRSGDREGVHRALATLDAAAAAQAAAR